MPIPVSPRQGRARRAVLGLAVASLFALPGCDASEDADLDRGRALFQGQCGQCHALAQAGTSADVGPSLDASFAQARADGLGSDTIEGIVESQIANPREIKEGDQQYSRVYMPADIVSGEDAQDVAAYVASVAGVPGAKPPPLGTADQIFGELCGGCHSLEAGAGDGTGPNLGDALAGQSPGYVEKQVVDPNSQLTPGFNEGIMPQDFEDRIPPDKLKQLVDYLLSQADEGGGTGSAGG